MPSVRSKRGPVQDARSRMPKSTSMARFKAARGRRPVPIEPQENLACGEHSCVDFRNGFFDGGGPFPVSFNIPPNHRPFFWRPHPPTSSPPSSVSPTLHPVRKISRPSHVMCVASQRACAGGPRSSQIICVEKSHLLRVGPIIIARGYR